MCVHTFSTEMPESRFASWARLFVFDKKKKEVLIDLIEAVWITILIVGSQITTMCTIGCTLHADVDRTSVIDALDDIFLKIQNKLVFVTDDL